MNTDERLKLLLNAPPDQLDKVDAVLERRAPAFEKEVTGPLLLGMGAGAKFLGTSRGTLWRMIRAGRLNKVEILPGSFRVRRTDLEAIAATTAAPVQVRPVEKAAEGTTLPAKTDSKVRPSIPTASETTQQHPKE
ncbi:MAG: helix-turn-helix domain-containing protein [Kiritimatiellaeota bacterium]|nr:helix-turn-helix domain-containing protein [Kiritimatiellota bacterium]